MKSFFAALLFSLPAFLALAVPQRNAGPRIIRPSDPLTLDRSRATTQGIPVLAANNTLISYFDRPAPLGMDTTDPLQMQVYDSPLSMIFSGFSTPFTPFRDLQLMDIAVKAQEQIIKEWVAGAKPDGAIPTPNLEWSSPHSGHTFGARVVYLRFNHQLDGGFT
ncbi:MAG: hypothetical protein Q9183_006085, partial [Haloplaca sp. 2 TL-2023]